jgi:hypothetical protein
MRLAVLAVLAVLSCGAPTTPGTPPRSAPRPAAIARSAPGEPTPPELTAPSDAPVCTFASELWRGEPISLAVRPDGEPFGVVATARLATARVFGERGWLEVDTGRVKLRGHFRASVPFLHPTRPLLLGGLLVTTGAARLSVEGKRGDRLLLSAAPPADTELLGEATVAATCGELTLDAMRFEVDASLPSDRPLQRASLVTGRAVLLSREPGGAPGLRVQLGERQTVAVISRRAGLARIVWRSEEGAVFGWVSAKDLAPPLPERAALTLAEVVQEGLEKPPPEALSRRATRAAPLVVEGRDGARATVGHITEGAILRAVPTVAGGLTRVDVEPLGLSLRAGVRAYAPGGALVEAREPAPVDEPAVVRAISALVKTCRERLVGPPHGRMGVRLVVDAEGRVTAVKMSAEPSLGRDLPDCLAAKVPAAKLPPNERGAMVEVSLSFSP